MAGKWSGTHSIRENSRAYVRLGAQQTKPENRSSDTNLIAGAGGQWASQRNRLFLDFTRSVGPVAAGTVVERHQLRLRIDHDVSQRFALRAGARFSRDEEIEDGTYPTREYAIGEVGFEWRWLRTLSLIGTYNYRWQEYEDEPSDARCHRLPDRNRVRTETRPIAINPMQTTQAAGHEPETTGFGDYLAILRKRRKLLLLVGLPIVASAWRWPSRCRTCIAPQGEIEIEGAQA